MKKILKNRTEFVIGNVIEAGLMRGADAARFIGVSTPSFYATHRRNLNEYEYEGQNFFSFLEVFELALKNDLKFSKVDIAKVKTARTLQHVERLDLIKTKLKNIK